MYYTIDWNSVLLPFTIRSAPFDEFADNFRSPYICMLLN